MRVLVIEDSIRLSRSIEIGLRRTGYAVDTAHDGEHGLSQALRNPYDVIVLDLMLPKRPGLEVLQALREQGLDSRILILTARDSVEDRVKGLRAGADDYLVKPFAFEELEARIESLVRRQYQSANPTLTCRDLTIDLTERVARVAGAIVSLSRREFGILEYLAQRKEQVVSRFDIQDHVYDATTFPTSNAVDAAICNLRSKLGKAGSTSVIETVRGVGYVLREHAP